MAEAFNEKETARIKEAGRELLNEMSAEGLANELGMRTVQILGMIRGNKAPTKELAEGVARLLGLSLADLLASVNEAPKPKAAAPESPPPTTAAVVAAPTIAEPESLSPTPPTPDTTAKTTRVDPKTEPASLLTPATLVETPTFESKTPAKRAPDAPLRPTLEMIDAAAVSMGLDLFPRRRDEIYREYGLSADDGETEMAAWREHLERNPRDRATWQSMREGSRNSWLRAEREKSGQSVAATKPSLDLPPVPLAMPPVAPAAPSFEPSLARSTLGTGRTPAVPPTVSMPDVAPPVAAKKIDPTVHFTGQDVFAALSADPPPATQAAPPPTVVEAPPTIQPERRPQKFDDRTMVLTKMSDRAADVPAPGEEKPAAAPRKKFDEPTMKHVANAPRQKSKYDDETMRALQPIAPVAPEPTDPKRRAPMDPTIAMPPEPHDAKKPK